MSKEILVSLIIPTYNCESFLDETLSSVLKQLPANCELIIVDDGSSDGTVEMLKGYLSDGASMRVYFEEHGGASVARNKGLQHAEGEYVAFMDCDDCQQDGFFEKALELTGSEADLYIFSFERVEHAGDPKLEETFPMLLEDRTYPTGSDFADEYVRRGHLLVYSGCNKFYKRSILLENDIRFREGLIFGEDRIFNYDYLRHCGHIVTSSLIMFRYMQRNEDSLSNRSYTGFFENVMMLHRAKLDCFLDMSKGTSNHEKRCFAGRDLRTEVSGTIERFVKHPEERDENLEMINRIFVAHTDRSRPENWDQDPWARETALDEIYEIGYDLLQGASAGYRQG